MMNLKASKKGGLLSVCPCPQFGIRPQVEISPTKVRKHITTLAFMIEEQSKVRPIALLDHNGTMVLKSSNWPA